MGGLFSRWKAGYKSRWNIYAIKGISWTNFSLRNVPIVAGSGVYFQIIWNCFLSRKGFSQNIGNRRPGNRRDEGLHPRSSYRPTMITLNPSSGLSSPLTTFGTNTANTNPVCKANTPSDTCSPNCTLRPFTPPSKPGLPTTSPPQQNSPARSHPH